MSVLPAALLATVLGTPALAGGDSPEISTHRGKRDGLIVLWPRVVPEESSPEVEALAEQIHQRLGQIALRHVDDSKLVVRPRPERVCPQKGCRAVSLGAVVGHHEGGCFAVGLVGLPDRGEVELVPWAGKVLASGRRLPFRDAPENKLVVKEFVPCERLVAELDDARIDKVLESSKATEAEVPDGA